MAQSTDTVVMERGTAGEVARLFTRLGFTAFGGPAAHIAMMRQEVVERRRWLNDAQFADLLGAVNLIPGPNSTELGIYLGYLRAGWLGLLLAGICFIGPAMLITLALAWAYVALGVLPIAGWFLFGVKPVVLAIILQALLGLGRTVLRGVLPIGIALAALVAYLLGLNELAVLVAAGVIMMILRLPRQPRVANVVTLLPLLSRPTIAVVVAGAASISMLAIFLTFLKIGAVLYGSGYVLLAFLHGDLVTRLHWLTERQLLDAVSVGQFTPGPVFTTATFIGYLIGGWGGALVATAGIFLPAFIFVPLIHPLATRLRRSPVTSALLDGVNAGALALMAGVLLQLGGATLRDPISVAIALVSLFILLRWKLNSAWLILAGGLLGLAVKGL